MSSGERELGLRREQASTCLYSRGGSAHRHVTSCLSGTSSPRQGVTVPPLYGVLSTPLYGVHSTPLYGVFGDEGPVVA